ncbi:EF-hand domain-containing protein [Xanthomonas arboricola]|uniref:EF-hand domain-containing protein n=1 Tax=Xanthomonas arboricola TaxID=56448 RepID=UPI0021586AB9|nr:EF-hand domain-containing protein [Xanthomonas arboricola]
MFKSIDSDSDGSLTASELATALSSNSDDDSKIDIDGLLSMLDQDGGGTVSESELAQALPPPPPPGEQGQDVQSLFAGLDSDGDDSVSSGELSTLVNGDSGSSTQLLDLLDSDRSGALSLQELQEAMQPRDPPPRSPSSVDASSSDGTQQAYAALVRMAVGQYRSVGGSAAIRNLVDLAA